MSRKSQPCGPAVTSSNSQQQPLGAPAQILTACTLPLLMAGFPSSAIHRTTRQWRKVKDLLSSIQLFSEKAKTMNKAERVPIAIAGFLVGGYLGTVVMPATSPTGMWPWVLCGLLGSFLFVEISQASQASSSNTAALFSTMPNVFWKRASTEHQIIYTLSGRRCLLGALTIIVLIVSAKFLFPDQVFRTVIAAVGILLMIGNYQFINDRRKMSVKRIVRSGTEIQVWYEK